MTDLQRTVYPHSGHPSAAGRAQDSVSSPTKDRRSANCATQPTVQFVYELRACMFVRRSCDYGVVTPGPPGTISEVFLDLTVMFLSTCRCRVTEEAWPLTLLATRRRLSPVDCRSHRSLPRPTTVSEHANALNTSTAAKRSIMYTIVLEHRLNVTAMRQYALCN